MATDSVGTLQWQQAEASVPPKLVLLDQTRLPGEEVFLDCSDVETVAEAIESLRVRGAPAIGVAAAYGTAIGAWQARGTDGMRDSITASMQRLARTRPTAVSSTPFCWQPPRKSRLTIRTFAGASENMVLSC
jgi:methylthioribose-1-phosphate isomerase